MGRRINIYLDDESDKIASQIDNLSEFIQVALSQAAGTLAFDIIKRKKGIVDSRVITQEQMDEWNRNHPLDPLTAKRLGKTQNGPTPKPLPRNPVIDN